MLNRLFGAFTGAKEAKAATAAPLSIPDYFGDTFTELQMELTWEMKEPAA